jgi:chemotaxis protein CheX
MSIAAARPTLKSFQPDPQLAKALLDGATNALSMCNTRAVCVGLASIPQREPGIVTGLLGVHGNVSGFITVNMGERFAIKAVEGLVQDRYDRITSQVVDGVGELTNIIGGGIKGSLTSSPWSFSNITIPSVIIGKGYQMAYGKGMYFLSATFEHDDEEAVLLEDRLMHVSLSLLRL